MKLKIIDNEKNTKNPIKFILKNFELVEEGEKLFLKYQIDKQKELRIFFKKTLLGSEYKEFIKKSWENEEDAEKLFKNLWIVKSKTSGVLLLVPEESEMSDKSGTFIFIISKLYSFPNPMYFKRSYINSNSIGLFKLNDRGMIFLLGKDTLTLVINQNDAISMKKYKEII